MAGAAQTTNGKFMAGQSFTEKLINNPASTRRVAFRSLLLSGMSLLQHSHPDQLLNMNGPGKMISLHKVDFLPLR
jgi:hypothetical protein